MTPLQQAHFAAEIAERGQIVATPRLVSAIRAAGSMTVIPRPAQLAQPDRHRHRGAMGRGVRRHGRRATSAIGTAHVAGFGAKYHIAGKTGTAQVFTIKQTDNTKSKIKDERKRDHSWFIAFAPADDPKIAVAVLVENGGFGASVAAPIARKVLDAYLLGVEPPIDPKKPVEAPARTPLEVPAAPGAI